MQTIMIRDWKQKENFLISQSDIRHFEDSSRYTIYKYYDLVFYKNLTKRTI